MAKVFILEDTLSEIGEAIRKKTGNPALLSPSEMVTAIGSIKTSVTPEISVTKETGKITATAGDATAEYQITESDDKDLVASNILSGVNIFGVSGSAKRAETGQITLESASQTITLTPPMPGYELAALAINGGNSPTSIVMMLYAKDTLNVYVRKTTSSYSVINDDIVVGQDAEGATTVTSDINFTRGAHWYMALWQVR